jgi:hypothetical protein
MRSISHGFEGFKPHACAPERASVAFRRLHFVELAPERLEDLRTAQDDRLLRSGARRPALRAHAVGERDAAFPYRVDLVANGVERLVPDTRLLLAHCNELGSSVGRVLASFHVPKGCAEVAPPTTEKKGRSVQLPGGVPLGYFWDMAQIADTFIEAIRGAQCARILDTLDGEAESFTVARYSSEGTAHDGSWLVSATSSATGERRSFRGADLADCLAQAAQCLTLEPSPRPVLELLELVK